MVESSFNDLKMILKILILSGVLLSNFSDARRTDPKCPDNHKYSFYMSNINSGYNMEVHATCMDADENTYIGGRFSNSQNWGLLVKLTYDGSVDWFM